MTDRYPCLCCGFLTLDEKPPGTYNICPVCFWEDDDVQAWDPDFEGGANRVSLRQAQENFRSFGASEARVTSYVRGPRAEECPDPSAG
jgi:hypothetical protein